MKRKTHGVLSQNFMPWIFILMSSFVSSVVSTRKLSVLSKYISKLWFLARGKLFCKVYMENFAFSFKCDLNEHFAGMECLLNDFSFTLQYYGIFYDQIHQTFHRKNHPSIFWFSFSCERIRKQRTTLAAYKRMRWLCDERVEKKICTQIVECVWSRICLWFSNS